MDKRLALALVLTLAACSGKTEDGTTAEIGSTEIGSEIGSTQKSSRNRFHPKEQSPLKLGVP